MTAIKYSTMPGVIKDIDRKKRIVVGYPSTFEHVDSMHEAVDAGAFKNTIERWGPSGKNRIKVLYQHNPTWLIGRPVDMAEDEFGLRTESQLSTTPQADDVFTLVEDKIITEQSIGYDVIDSYNDDDGVRHLKELRLWEYSFVTWGANDITPIVGTKSEGRALIEMLAAMQKSLERGDWKTDEIPMMLELTIKQLEGRLKDNEKPIGPFADFDECVRRMAGRVDDPEAYCGSLERDNMAATPALTASLKDVSQWARTMRLKRDLDLLTRGLRKS